MSTPSYDNLNDSLDAILTTEEYSDLLNKCCKKNKSRRNNRVITAIYNNKLK
jgi:hypothetical protein